MVFIAVAVCKVLYFIGSRVGRGSSLSGQVALRLCPRALERLKLPERIIAVTGSNGKTSTVEFIARALEADGMSVGWNHEGSNQIEGIATLLLRIATLGGSVRRDALVLECDERYTRAIFDAVKPSVLVVTNLCRDQLTRNGHHEFIFDCIRSAIAGQGGITLVLNADDPYVAALSAAEVGIRNSEFGTGGGCGADPGSKETQPGQDSLVWFGIGGGALPSDQRLAPNDSSALRTPHAGSPASTCYDDGAFCPVCKGRMTYGYRTAGHYGAFHCGTCGHSRKKPDIEVTSLDFETGDMTIAPQDALRIPDLPGNDIKTRLRLPSLAGAYNLAAAIAAVAAAGTSAAAAARALDGYELEGGRTIRFSAGGRDGTLLISKHENSFSYNQSMDWIVRQDKPCTVIVMVSSISRKYYTSETSWLWDVDFDILESGCVRNVVLAGRYYNELMARFAMSAVSPEKYFHVSDISALRAGVGKCEAETVYAITCFADKAKLLKAFE